MHIMPHINSTNFSKSISFTTFTFRLIQLFLIKNPASLEVGLLSVCLVLSLVCQSAKRHESTHAHHRGGLGRLHGLLAVHNEQEYTD